MPGRTTPTATAMNGNGAPPSAKRFQLPALDLKFGALTDGTNIPPPLPSPIAEEPDEKTAVIPKKETHAAAAAPPNKATVESPDSAKIGLKRSADDSPISPTFSHRQGSIRRLFSRNLLNTAYADGEVNEHGAITSPTASTNGTTNGNGQYSRPHSRGGSIFGYGGASNGSTNGDRSSRRTSWFKRLRSADANDKRSSRFFGNETSNSRMNSTTTTESQASRGPPPPTIPEFKTLGSKVDVDKDAGKLGDNLFENIR